MNPDFDTSIINIADDFYEAYLRCAEGKKPVKEGGCIRYGAANVPAIVNGAFAMELYLKSISQVSEKELKQKKHSLKALFLTLELPIQDEIRQSVESQLDGRFTFDECLKGINHAFVFWRYIHKQQNFGFGLNNTLLVLPIFLETIRDIAKCHRQ